jgi:hypothetical protein
MVKCQLKPIHNAFSLPKNFPDAPIIAFMTPNAGDMGAQTQ